MQMMKILRVPVKTKIESEAKETFLKYTDARDYVVYGEIKVQKEGEEMIVSAQVQSSYETKE
jgi:hypothetical protein